jgi:hypothetical protein
VNLDDFADATLIAHVTPSDHQFIACNRAHLSLLYGDNDAVVVFGRAGPKAQKSKSPTPERGRRTTRAAGQLKVTLRKVA